MTPSKRRVRIGFFVALSLTLLVRSAADAAPITYEFTVTATGGPLSGTTSTGTFTYDSSIVPAGGGDLDQTGLLTDLDFTWNGIHYDETSANTGFLNFDTSGALVEFGFGNDCIAGGCTVSPFVEEWLASRNVGLSLFVYGTPTSTTNFGSLTLELVSSSPPPSAVPEPTSMSLLALGLGGGALARFRRKRVRG